MMINIVAILVILDFLSSKYNIYIDNLVLLNNKQKNKLITIDKIINYFINMY